MDVKREPEEELMDAPDFVEPDDLDKLKKEKMQPPEPVELKCETCEEIFTSSVALKVHELLHSTSCFCTICRVTIRNNNFRKHVIDRHMNIECEICGKVFNLKKSLDGHLRSHKKERIFSCDKCDKTFMQRGSLLTHKKSVHEGIKPFACEVCTGTFTTSSSLRKHVRKMHSENEEYECRLCCKKFTDKKQKLDHENQHTQSKECEFCGKKYRSGYDLSKHLRMVHFNTEECIYCKRMLHKSIIDVHILERHAPKQCKICDLTFHDTLSWKRHEVTHLTRVLCKLCNRHYREDNIEKHMELHREKNEEICSICNILFSNIDVHNARVHRNTNFVFCQYCSEKFQTKELEEKHVTQVHRRKFRKQCNGCKRIMVYSGLSSHSLVSSKKFLCRRCKQRDGIKQGLAQQVKGKRTKVLRCDCGFECVQRLTMRKHYVRAHILTKEEHCVIQSENVKEEATESKSTTVA